MLMIARPPGVSCLAVVKRHYSQLPHRGYDGPGVGRRSGLGAHCVGCEADRCLEHKSDYYKNYYNKGSAVNKMQARCLLASFNFC
jgi:hypothetical protein